MRRLTLFDVDSTLIGVESLDVAARLALAGRDDAEARLARIEEITTAAMEGALPFDEALENRLALLDMTRATIQTAAAEIAETATPGMAELLARLRKNNDGVMAVSGGFRLLIAPALDRLGFSADMTHANDFLFEGSRVIGADFENPLARPGGKIEVARALRAEVGADHVTMVGDGATDLEVFAAGAADAFIGFGGHATRNSVKARAPHFARDVNELDRLIDTISSDS